MSDGYRAVQWNQFKRAYDAALLLLILGYVAAFFIVGKLLFREPNNLSDEILVLRALGTGAFVLLNVTLCIGPLARLDQRFLPLLYNRRHLGVATFSLGLAHAILATGYYHGFGRISPAVSLLSSNVQYRSIAGFPFEMLGLVALVILFLMAATSHDFWLKVLSPRVWKGLHMLVYLAWAVLVMHVALGALQTSERLIYAGLLAAVIVIVPGLHLVAGVRQIRRERTRGSVHSGQWIDVAAIEQIPYDGRGFVAHLPRGEPAAIYRWGGKLSALSNVCAHQGGPLGEGRILDGCVTCPWHGYQYLPDTGCAPPPFTDRLPLYRLRVQDGRVLIDPEPLPPGTRVEAAVVEEAYARV